jgi:hypothetical protein
LLTTKAVMSEERLGEQGRGIWMIDGWPIPESKSDLSQGMSLTYSGKQLYLLRDYLRRKSWAIARSWP